jgi:hypothetical protein
MSASIKAGLNNDMHLMTDGVTRAYVDGNGKVGIGTTSPSKKFVVSEGGVHGFEISPYDGSQNATRLINYNRSTNAYFPLEIEASQIAFETNGSEKMRIDPSGYVTTPSQPMFSAHGGAEQTGDVKEVIQFTSATSNVGNHFSTSTYTFTAPVSGHYHFSFSLMTYASDNSRCQFAKNGSLIADQFYAEADGYAEYPRNGASIIVQLSTNDTLRVDRNVQNSASERCHQNYRSFTGYLIG